MSSKRCVSCDPCEKRLRLLRERCRLAGIETSFDDSEFWWFCFANRAARGLASAGADDALEWLAARPIPPKKKRPEKLASYVLSRFPVPEVQRRFLEFARGMFPEVFEGGDPEEAIKRIESTNRDPYAARFILKAIGVDVPLPEGFNEKCYRIRYEIMLREHALRRMLSDPQNALIRKTVEKACSSRDEMIARYREKLERGSQIIAEKTAEAEYYRKLAEEMLGKMQEMQSFYQAEVERLHKRILELGRSDERVQQSAVSAAGVGAPQSLKVLIIGDPSRENAYRESLSLLGIETRFIDGIDRTCDATVARNVDLVVIVGDYGKHSVFEKVKPEAKKHDVPVITVPSGGVSTVVNAVRSRFGLGKMDIGGIGCR